MLQKGRVLQKRSSPPNRWLIRPGLIILRSVNEVRYSDVPSSWICFMRKFSWCLGAVMLAAVWPALVHSESEILPPLGPYMFPAAADFAATQSWASTNRLVSTSYFYWYDVYSGAHLKNPDGSDALTDHPPTLTDFSFRSKWWHKAQLQDMMAAGI